MNAVLCPANDAGSIGRVGASRAGGNNLRSAAGWHLKLSLAFSWRSLP